MREIQAPNTYAERHMPPGLVRDGGHLYSTIIPDSPEETFVPFEVCFTLADQQLVGGSKAFIGKDMFKGFGGVAQAPYFSAKNSDVEPYRLKRLASLFEDLPREIQKRVLQLHEYQGTLVVYMLGVGWSDLNDIMPAWQKHEEAHVILCGSEGKYKLSGDATDIFLKQAGAAQ